MAPSKLQCYRQRGRGGLFHGVTGDRHNDGANDVRLETAAHRNRRDHSIRKLRQLQRPSATDGRRRAMHVCPVLQQRRHFRRACWRNGTGVVILLVIRTACTELQPPSSTRRRPATASLARATFMATATTDILLDNGQGTVIDWMMKNAMYRATRHRQPVASATALLARATSLATDHGFCCLKTARAPYRLDQCRTAL